MIHSAETPSGNRWKSWYNIFVYIKRIVHNFFILALCHGQAQNDVSIIVFPKCNDIDITRNSGADVLETHLNTVDDEAVPGTRGSLREKVH